jgi:N-acyl-D-amino-acid deacylase
VSLQRQVVPRDRLHERVPEYVRDVPGGAGRFVQGADGFVATVCNGDVILENDQRSGARPGHVLR